MLSNFPHVVVGARGEDRAADFLRQKGYSVLARNWRKGVLEIDVVAIDTETKEIVFAEVKTRTAGVRFGHPSLAVDQRKMRAMQKAAKAFLQDSNLENEYRFDIIAVLPGQIDHFENVSWLR